MTQTNDRKKLHIDQANKAVETNERDQLFLDYSTSASSEKLSLESVI